MKRKQKLGKHSLGMRIEELVKLKNKAKVEAEKSTELYVTETVKEAQRTVERLQSRLNQLQSKDQATETSMMHLVDEMFKILFEERKDLDNIENDYEFWTNINKKFND
ncbi:hypothetical protein [uncultured Clostridium sp.]|uniref:hypothetical protein n=1 Tax=uncultured Clostridium sp. TaxID=59620 RepID=UPI0026F00CEC|nr:hypothetical protein [uncultured Clostridium sp.]